MDALYWKQSWDGERDALLAQAPDAATRELVELNFGPWDRLNEDKPFIDGIRPAAAGRTFYPADMTKEEFEAADAAGQDGPSTRCCAATPAGKLITVPFHEAYKAELEQRRGAAARGRAAQRRTRPSATTCACAPTRCSATTSAPATWPGWT